jgi:6-pyruvoyltetrahydropterin/6-carboxytetrahydropterin synthase
MGTASGSATLVVVDAQCRFPAAHLALHDDSCESLHGHTYTITLRVAGHIETSTGMVLDYRLLKTRLRRVVAPLSHRVLVPGLSPLLTIQSAGGHVRVECRPKRYLFPSEDVAILHLTNTTTELLARYLLDALDMRTAGGALRRAELEVAEAPGQPAVVEWTPRVGSTVAAARSSTSRSRTSSRPPCSMASHPASTALSWAAPGTDGSSATARSSRWWM